MMIVNERRTFDIVKILFPRFYSIFTRLRNDIVKKIFQVERLGHNPTFSDVDLDTYTEGKTGKKCL